MFVRKTEYDAVVTKNTELQQEVEKLTSELETAKANSGNQTELTEKVTSLETEKATLETQLTEANQQVEEASARVTVLETENQSLKTENAKLSELPGAESAKLHSKTEASHGKNLSELDAANEFCKNNPGDILGGLEAMRKAGVIS